MLSATRLIAIARKEALQLSRDPRSLVLAFALPPFLLLFFGYAITWDVRNIQLVVYNQDMRQASRTLIQTLEASGYFTVVEYLGSLREVDDRLKHGKATGALVIPPGFSKILGSHRPASVQLLLDGSDANTATIALNYANAIVTRYSRGIVLQGRRIQPPAEAQTRVWYNPTLESRNMIVPGLIAVIMSIIAAMLTALTIAREWERGTMEQLAATPVHRLEVVFGKLVPYLAIGLFDVTITIVAGILIFNVPLRGSLLLLGGMTVLFLVGALGVGMFISAVLKAQVPATQVAILASYMPALLLSGFLFDIASMPLLLRAVTFIVPARYYIVVTRGIFLKGVGLEALWPEAIAMIVFAAIGVGLAADAFKKRIAA